MGKEPNTSPPPDAIASAFRLALDAACVFEGATAPNPPVGCVILDSAGSVLSVAAHQRAGEPHAEALAIAQCRKSGLADKIHTLVVTLEPCNHFGRTPPCSQAVLGTSTQAVWIGVSDPNAGVIGGGAKALTAAGVAVRTISQLDHSDAQILGARAERLIGPFAKRMRMGLPWITIKQALNWTGGMIPPTGTKTFTAHSSLVLAHRLRRRADAILTGSGTVLADIPLFTVRHVPDFAGKVRYLAILDRRGRVSADYLRAARERGFMPIVARDLARALQQLADAGTLEVLVEAGPQVTESLLASRLWDEHVRVTSNPSGEDSVEVLTNPSSFFSLAERT